MKRQLLRTAIVGLLFMGAVLLGLGSQEQALPEGQPAPPLRGLRLEGGEAAIGGAGEVLLVNFWTTWCPPCREEMPTLLAVAARFAPQGVRFVAANLDDQPDQREAVAAYLGAQPGLAPHVLLADPAAATAFRVDVFPTTYVIDRHGQIRWAHVGAVSEREAAKAIEAALGP